MDNSLFYGDLATSKRVIYTPSKFAHSQLIHLQEIGELQAQKPPIYHKFADIEVVTGVKPFEELIKEIEGQLP